MKVQFVCLTSYRWDIAVCKTTSKEASWGMTVVEILPEISEIILLKLLLLSTSNSFAQQQPSLYWYLLHTYWLNRCVTMLDGIQAQQENQGSISCTFSSSETCLTASCKKYNSCFPEGSFQQTDFVILWGFGYHMLCPLYYYCTQAANIHFSPNPL